MSRPSETEAGVDGFGSLSRAGGADPEAAAERFVLGDWRIDPAARELTDGARTRRISPKAIGVLLELVAARGRVVSRDDLLERVWPDVIVGEESLTHTIAELRGALEDPARAPRLIETVRKSGYRLLATAEPAAAQPPGEASGFDLEAHLLCGEAATLRDRAGTGDIERATLLCAEAVAQAPRYAPGHSAFAIAAVFRRLCADQRGPGFDAAMDAAETAVRLRPDLATTHTSRGYALGVLHRWSEAFAAFDRALSCDPRDLETHFLYARVRFIAGDIVTAARLAERAAALHPSEYRTLYLAAVGFAATGQPERARAAALAGLARTRRRLDDAPGDIRAEITQAQFMGQLGRRHDALDIVAPRQPVATPLAMVAVSALATAGETSIALRELERAADEGWRHAAWLRADPALAPLRDEARFRRIERAMAGA